MKPANEKEERLTISQFKKDNLKNASQSSKWSKNEGEVAVDVFQKDSELVILAPIAGVNSSNIDISIENKMLIIKGSRQNPEESEKNNYFYQECFWGKFHREISLPENVNISQSKATLKKGILKITIPLLKKEKKKKIEIE
ncbi:Hsp20/alpha crystallin family protein [bacterium]|nr:Hsp20/alpha crystallin family protein [bacterium]